MDQRNTYPRIPEADLTLQEFMLEADDSALSVPMSEVFDVVRRQYLSP
jgi:hypothetical protein